MHANDSNEGASLQGEDLVFPVVVAEWDRNARELIRVALDRYNGTPTIDVRTWYRAGDGSIRPGKSGITISVRHLPALAESLAQALAQARALRLVDDRSGQ